MSHGCSRIAAELQEARQSLTPQIEPAHRELVQTLAAYLKPDENSAALPTTAWSSAESGLRCAIAGCHNGKNSGNSPAAQTSLNSVTPTFSLIRCRPRQTQS